MNRPTNCLNIKYIRHNKEASQSMCIDNLIQCCFLCHVRQIMEASVLRADRQTDMRLSGSFFGQRSQRGQSPVEHRGMFICLFVHPFVCFCFLPGPLMTQILPQFRPLKPQIRPLLRLVRPQIRPFQPQIRPFRPLRPQISRQMP